MAKINLIDGNSVGHAAHRATKLTSGRLQTQAIFGFVNGMRNMRVRMPDFTPMILWDERAQWRYDLFPGYKSNRESDPKKVEERERYAEQKPYIIRAAKALGLRQVSAKNYEADDLAGYFVNKLVPSAGSQNEIVLSTGDVDWAQLVRPGVTWVDHREDDKIITPATIMDRTGFATPYALLEGKCLVGDTSDTITGVGGIGATGAPEFLAEFGSVREFWRRCDSGEFKPTKKAHLSLWKGDSKFAKEDWLGAYEEGGGDITDKKALKKHMDAWPGQGRKIFMRNFRLMNLLRVPEPPKADVRVIHEKPNKEEFANLCGELGFISIMKKLDVFFRPFETK